MDQKRIKVLISKAGLDGHDKGAKIVAHFLRDAGMEVVYLGVFQWPESIVDAAIQEDADVIGLSILSGEHLTYPRRVVELLKERGVRDDILVVLGGIVPRQSFEMIKEAGVDEIFESGTPMPAIIQYITDNVPRKGKE
ncbi:cobalamin B12-binding domain-containing protein [Thermodesulfobacteriota bacterium]